MFFFRRISRRASTRWVRTFFVTVSFSVCWPRAATGSFDPLGNVPRGRRFPARRRG